MIHSGRKISNFSFFKLLKTELNDNKINIITIFSGYVIKDRYITYGTDKNKIIIKNATFLGNKNNFIVLYKTNAVIILQKIPNVL